MEINCEAATLIPHSTPLDGSSRGLVLLLFSQETTLLFFSLKKRSSLANMTLACLPKVQTAAWCVTLNCTTNSCSFARCRAEAETLWTQEAWNLNHLKIKGCVCASMFFFNSVAINCFLVDTVLRSELDRPFWLPLDYLLRWIGIASQCSIVKTIKLKIIWHAVGSKNSFWFYLDSEERNPQK